MSPIASRRDFEAAWAAEERERLKNGEGWGKGCTSYTPNVVVEFFLQSVGGVLLLCEVLQVLVEYVVCCSIYFAEILQYLREKILFSEKLQTERNLIIAIWVCFCFRA